MDTFFSSKRFILLIALLMGLTAFGIDAVLPAFPDLTHDFALPPGQENHIHYVIFAFMLGFASLQLPFGILADTYGRKTMLSFGLCIYIAASALALLVNDFNWLLAARFMQGAGLAAPRVISLTIVRDVSSGRTMSRIMSFVMMIFIIIPILAPSIGQLALKYGSWQSIFWLFVIIGFVTLTWMRFDLPETLHPEDRSSFRLKGVIKAIGCCLTHAPTLVYLAMLSLLFAMLMTYISQAEQIFQREIYGLEGWFPLVFGLTASGILFASLTNSRYVIKIGMHKMVRYALKSMLVIDLIMFTFTFVFAGKMPLPLFVILFMFHMFCYGILMPNINSLILEPHGQVAGTASALIGTLMTIIGVIIANAISGQFNGTLYPLTGSYAIISSLLFILNGIVCRLTHEANETRIHSPSTKTSCTPETK